MADPNLSSFLWSVADLLRGDYKQSDYGKVILPFTVLRRLDCVLEPTKPAELSRNSSRSRGPGSIPNRSCCARPGRASTTRPSWTVDDPLTEILRTGARRLIA